MKLYISGPMTGVRHWNHPTFQAATRCFRALGHSVVCPTEVFNGDTGRPWHEYMRKHLSDLPQCDGIALLPGWKTSRGAVIEALVAKICQLHTTMVLEIPVAKDQPREFYLEEIELTWTDLLDPVLRLWFFPTPQT